MADNLVSASVLSDEVIRPFNNSVHPYGGIAVLKGNLAEQSAVVKQVAVKEDMWHVTRPARVFDSEEEALNGLLGGKIKEGDILVIRNEGPKGGPGMSETLAMTMGFSVLGIKKAAIITDDRFSGGTEGPCIGHYDGGPISLVKDGDEITTDIPDRKLELHVSDEELKKRKAAWKPFRRELPEGFVQRYVKYVVSASKGAILS